MEPENLVFHENPGTQTPRPAPDKVTPGKPGTQGNLMHQTLMSSAGCPSPTRHCPS